MAPEALPNPNPTFERLRQHWHNIGQTVLRFVSSDAHRDNPREQLGPNQTPFVLDRDEYEQRGTLDTIDAHNMVAQDRARRRVEIEGTDEHRQWYLEMKQSDRDQTIARQRTTRQQSANEQAEARALEAMADMSPREWLAAERKRVQAQRDKYVAKAVKEFEDHAAYAAAHRDFDPEGLEGEEVARALLQAAPKEPYLSKAVETLRKIYERRGIGPYESEAEIREVINHPVQLPTPPLYVAPELPPDPETGRIWQFIQSATDHFRAAGGSSKVRFDPEKHPRLPGESIEAYEKRVDDWFAIQEERRQKQIAKQERQLARQHQPQQHRRAA